jgi:hypothetical protein
VSRVQGDSIFIHFSTLPNLTMLIPTMCLRRACYRSALAKKGLCLAAIHKPVETR